MRLYKKMPSFNAVAPGQTAIANLPVGLAYHQLAIRYTRDVSTVQTDATSTHFGSDFNEIRLIIDGDVKWRLTGAELVMLNSYYGVYDGGFTAGVLAMLFSRPWHRTSQGEDFTQIGTADVQTMTLEIDIDGAVVNPVLELYAVQGPNAKLGNHVCIRKFAYNAAATGIREIPDLPRGPYSALALHLGTANISSVQVEANQRIVFEADKPLAEQYYEQTGRVWQTGFWHIDFAPTDRLSDALPLVLEDFRLKANVSSAGSFNILIERVEARAAA